jgi:hypothetical protein
MDAGDSKVEAIQRLLFLSEELLNLDVRGEQYTEALEAYSLAIEQHLERNAEALEVGSLDILAVSPLLNELRRELLERHQLVLERAILGKEVVVADLAKLRRTRRGMIAYLSQSLDKKES